MMGVPAGGAAVRATLEEKRLRKVFATVEST